MLYKIVFTALKEEADAIRDALGKAGAGVIGEYSFCSFTISGVGRFLPSDDAEPLIGENGELTKVEEERIEVTCSYENVSKALDAIRSIHSYEEPAIDIYPLINESDFKEQK